MRNPKSDEHRKNMRKPQTETHRKNNSEGHKGIHPSKETLDKMSKSHRERIKPIIICPHCGKAGGGRALMNRWHFDHCKLKDNS
jgi:hypothetical protein